MVLSLALVAQAFAIPNPLHWMNHDINVLDDVILFDAPAFQNPANSAETIVALQSFVFLREINLHPLRSAIASALSKIGVTVDDKVATAAERLKLFAAIGVHGTVKATVTGCSSTSVLSVPSHGLALGKISLGHCSSGSQFTAQVKTSAMDSRTFHATIFDSTPGGFGVISGNFVLFLSHCIT